MAEKAGDAKSTGTKAGRKARMGAWKLSSDEERLVHWWTFQFNDL